ncbi:hypothetical protein P3X46_023274 [Hevea brasiliensis]|uniref:Uncharacterized protein n=1 Tax=Hevea brasiliensis TaxID=3981 RepID=A0ABQ9LAF1_HEVBR|nr:hypothetical protein P3X46_023274 [Hevea brasiliensis]
MEMAKVVKNWWSHSKNGFDENGPTFLKHGETSQSLSLSDFFTLKDGSVTPVLKAANPPVRANVLYLSPEYSSPISESLKHIFSPYFDNAIWFQNSGSYHFSMFHASHHIVPVPATEDEIEAEATAVGAVAEGLCPLKLVLDRVVLTLTGVLQVISGPDPITIRAKLRSALPHAPEKQLYDAAILHTSFARLLDHPKASPVLSLCLLLNTFIVIAHLCSYLFVLILSINCCPVRAPSNELQFFHELVAFSASTPACFLSVLSSTNEDIFALHVIQAVISKLWYVEEYDVLALALDGRMKVRRFQLVCKRT